MSVPREEYGPYRVVEHRYTLDDPLDPCNGTLSAIESFPSLPSRSLANDFISTLVDKYLSEGFTPALPCHGPFYTLVQSGSGKGDIAILFEIEPQSEHDHLVACVRQASAELRGRTSRPPV